MSRKMLLLTMLAVATALVLVSPSSRAQALTPLAELQRAAEQFLIERVGDAAPGTRTLAMASALDPRLRLPACSSKLEGFLPQGARPGARTTVGVRCPSPAWTVYVPVNVETETTVLVLKRAAPRLGRLTAADVEPQARRVPGFSATYISDASQLAGRHLRQAAAPGTALTVDMLATDVLVRRGQRVTLLSRAGGIEVTAPGEAVSDARPDGRVRVRNLGSGRIVEGVVESADRVRVGS